MATRVITLTTDFGSADAYVGAMKGVALGIKPGLNFVDITHEVPPQDIAHGAFVLGSAYRYFPKSTVHVAVVDPGVGTERRAVLLITPVGSFVTPDNGLLSYVLRHQMRFDEVQIESTSFAWPVTIPVPSECKAYELMNPKYWRHPVSDTFHGRDVFAPVAAHLASGVPIETIGRPIHELTVLNLFTVGRSGDAIDAKIIHVDRFGNLVSNAPGDLFPDDEVEVEVAGVTIPGLRRAFAEVEGLLTLVGSHGYLEVAENGGSAARRLRVGVGATIRVRNEYARPV